MYPNNVRPMLIRRSHSHPTSANTPNGGRMIANMILHMSLQVNGIMSLFAQQLTQLINYTRKAEQKRIDCEFEVSETK